MKGLQLEEFPLTDGGILYFSPDTVGLVESDEIIRLCLQGMNEHADDESLIRDLSSRFPEDYIRSSLDTLRQLAGRGIIGSLADEERRSMVESPLPPLIRIIVSNTNACNLACRYCYNRFKDTAGSFDEALSLSEKHISAALELLARHSAGARELELLFIGGEPLIRFDLIRYAALQRSAVAGLSEKKVRIFLISNGTLIDREILDFCSSRNIHIKLSIDGTDEKHDRNRVFPDGTGTYETIFRMLPDYFHHYTHPCKAVTATVDSFRDDLPSLVEHFAVLGFRQIELTELYGCREDISPPEGGSEPFLGSPGGRLLDEERERLEKNYRTLAGLLYHRIRSRQFIHLIPFYDPLYFLHRRLKKIYPCRTGFDSVALFSDGFFYPCHHYMGDATFVMGDLEKGIVKDRFGALRRPVIERDHCRQCWGRFLCGGECYHRALVEGSDMYGVYERGCFRKKTLFREAIYLYHRLREEDPEGLKWYFSVRLYP